MSLRVNIDSGHNAREKRWKSLTREATVLIHLSREVLWDVLFRKVKILEKSAADFIIVM